MSRERILPFLLLASCAGPPLPEADPPRREGPAREPRLGRPIRLTDGGANAEAYFSPDGSRLIFQSTRPPHECDQIFTTRADGSGARLLSTGKGRTTCAYFFPDGRRFLYSSTHLDSPECPPVPPRSRDLRKYYWPIYPSYEIFVGDLDHPEAPPLRLTESPGYDAEATIAPDGSKIVFTSTRDGDIEVYSMNLDGTGVRRLTHSPGYDGGAVFSPDSKRIVFRADQPRNEEERRTYEDLLARDLVNPTRVEIFVMNADGSGRRPVTRNGAANFAPCYTPDGERILFSSNLGEPTGFDFQLYLVREDGSGLEQVTAEGSFNCFPMFSPDGRRLVFITNRFVEPGQRAYDVALADWRE